MRRTWLVLVLALVVLLIPTTASAASRPQQALTIFTVWVHNDINQDGLIQLSEPDVSGVEIDFVNRAGKCWKTYTNSIGRGDIALPAGNYTVFCVLPDSSWHFTADTSLSQTVFGKPGQIVPVYPFLIWGETCNILPVP